MFEVTIKDVKGATFTLALNETDNVTVHRVVELVHEQQLFRSVTEIAELLNALTAIDGNEIPDAFRSVILASAVEPDQTFLFGIDFDHADDESADVDADGEEEDDNEDDESGEDDGDEECDGVAPERPEVTHADGDKGVCTVLANNGVESVTIQIRHRKTVVYDVIHCDVVKARFGLSDSQIASKDVYRNGESVMALNDRVVSIGDEIVLANRYASSKG